MLPGLILHIGFRVLFKSLLLFLLNNFNFRKHFLTAKPNIDDLAILPFQQFISFDWLDSISLGATDPNLLIRISTPITELIDRFQLEVFIINLIEDGVCLVLPITIHSVQHRRQKLQRKLIVL